MRPLADAAADVLAEHGGGLAVAPLVRAVKAAGVPRASAALLERALRGDDRFRVEDVLGRPVWSVSDAGEMPDGRRAHGPPRASVAEAAPVQAGSPLAGLDLREWQVRAFAAWAAAGCRGVVEAVTGTGKTRLAVAAVRAVLARGGRALVLVPTLELQDQWVREVRALVPGARAGRLGGGVADDLDTCHVLVATPQSAAGLPLEPPGEGLLVADEAHRYGAPTWSAALHPAFALRLALTATYERTDDGLIDVLGPYFGGVVHRYGFLQAAEDETIAPFRIAFAGVPLTEAERASYDAADRRVRELRRELVSRGLPREPLALLAAAAELVGRAGAGALGERTDGAAAATAAAAQGYLAAVRGRRDVAARADGKLATVRTVAQALARVGRGGGAVRPRALVFPDTVDQADAAVLALRASGVRAARVSGDVPMEERRRAVGAFRAGRLSCLVAPRVLDEGVDVPDADLAVVLASFRSRRQMVQRLGRVLRRKADGREARLVVVFAEGTREDPAHGAQEEFLAEVLPVAREVRVLGSSSSERGADLATWLGGA